MFIKMAVKQKLVFDKCLKKKLWASDYIKVYDLLFVEIKINL